MMNNTFDKILKIYDAGFRQQHESTCGPASIILSAIELGFDAKDEEQWRDDSFARWMPVDDFLTRGMALHELSLISEVIYAYKLNIQAKRAYADNCCLFKNDVKNSFQTMNSVVVVNYQQSDFIERPTCLLGNPHYSPIIGWDESTQGVLIADVDYDINKSYWVNIEALFCSMEKPNQILGIPRGWLVVSKLKNGFSDEF